MRGWILPILIGLVLVSCARDNSGYRGPTPGRTTPTVPAEPAAVGTAIGAESDGNAPGIPELRGTIETTPSGLRYIDQQLGGGTTMGIAPQQGQNVSVHYTGWLTNGTKFDSSVDRGQPFVFRLGMGQVIKGWDEGVGGMGLGGKRRLIIPPQLGYGDVGSPASPGSPGIPGNSTLIFDVELLGIAN